MAKFCYFKIQEIDPDEYPNIVEKFNDDSLMYDMFNYWYSTYVRLDEDLIKAIYVPLEFIEDEYYEVTWLPYKTKLLKDEKKKEDDNNG